MHSFQVWAAVPPWKQGSLAEFATLTEFEVSSTVAFMVSPSFNPSRFLFFRDVTCAARQMPRTEVIIVN